MQKYQIQIRHISQVTLLNRMSDMQNEIDNMKRPQYNNVNSLIQEIGQLKQTVDDLHGDIDSLKRNITEIRMNLALEEELLGDIDEFDRKVRKLMLSCLTKKEFLLWSSSTFWRLEKVSLETPKSRAYHKST